MKLSVVITHYKTPQILEKCLAALAPALKGLKSEAFVSDSETSDQVVARIKTKFPWVKFLAHTKNVGYGRLVNDGFKESKGDFILIINADIILPEKVLKEWLDFMERHPSIGVSRPKLTNLDGSLQYSCFRFYTPLTIPARRTAFSQTKYGRHLLARFLMYDYERRVAKEVDWLMGSALLISRVALEKVGLMDERFFLYFEDVDWCRRCWLAGFKVAFNPKIEITHYHMKASDKKGGLRDVFSNHLTRIHILSAFKYFVKYLGQKPPIH